MINSTETLKKEEGFLISGISGPVFLVFSALILLGTYMGVLKGGLIGSLTFLLAPGGLTTVIGDNTPILKDYLGGVAVAMLLTGLLGALIGFGCYGRDS